MTSLWSGNYWKSVLSRPPHSPEVKIIQIQCFHDQQILLKCKVLKISPFKITTPTQDGIFPINPFKTTTPPNMGLILKSVISRPPHPPKTKSVQNQSFQEHHTLQKWKLLKINSFKSTIPSQSKIIQNQSFPDHISSQCGIDWKSGFFSKTLHSSKADNVYNQFFPDHHRLPKWKLLKISPFRTTIPSQSKNYSKSLFSWPPCPPKVISVKISLLKTTTHPLKVESSKLVLSRPPHPLMVKINQNQCCHDHHILPKWKMLKINPFNMTAPSQNENCLDVMSSVSCENWKWIWRSESS